jgi:2-polyprenyl-3-methyl-5-hydroxy-6-metoxy-1,4-benzoquinol methylase
MPINFHDDKNRMTYTTRDADEFWVSLIEKNVEVTGKQVIDIGCGGGIYSKSFLNMGASHVIGVDFSEEMFRGASQNCMDCNNVLITYEMHSNQMDLVCLVKIRYGKLDVNTIMLNHYTKTF